MRRYIRNRLTGQGPAEAVDVLAGRVSGEADGNFLYAFYVTGTVIQSGSLAGSDEKTARGLPLPTGGLAGVYEDFLDRQIAGDQTRWTGELRPVLAPLCVALGDGFTTAQLAAVASRLTGQDFSLTKAGDVTRAAGQFLDGPRPTGPFRMYHQSFSRFLTDPDQNPNWPIDITETNSAVAQGLIGTVPESQPGIRNWATASAYVRRHLAAHAAAAGILDDLLLDPGYLLAAHPPSLLAVLNAARSPAARLASAAYRRAAHRLADPAQSARGSYLRLAALQVGAEDLLASSGIGSDQGAQEPGWFPAWAWWRPGIASRVVGELPSSAAALATVITEQEALAVVGGEFGLQVWDLEAGQRLATRPWKVLSVAAGQVGGRPVALAGHNDGIVTLYELPSLEVLARDEATHTGDVLAAAVLGGGSAAATGDDEGTLVLWQLPTLKALATRPKAHTMVRGLSDASLGGAPLLVSVGDALERSGHRNPETGPVRVWTVPELHLYGDVKTGVDLSRFAAVARTPQGCIVVFERGVSVEAHLIAADGVIKPIDKRESFFATHLLVLEEGSQPQILVCGYFLALLQIILPLSALALGAQVEVERAGPFWAGPVDLTDRPFLVSAASTLRAWDLGEVLAALQQDDLSYGREEYDVSALAASGDVLAALTNNRAVHRWQWHSAEAMAPLAVRSERIATLASCMLAGQPHFAIAYDDGIVEAFDASSGERWPVQIAVGAPLQAMAIGEHHGQTIAVTAVQLGEESEAGWKGRPFYGVRLWDLITGTEIPTRLPDEKLAFYTDPDNHSFTWKLTIGGYADKQVQNLIAVETADDLLIVAQSSRKIRVWPLSDTLSGFDVGDRRDSISALAGRRELLATGDSDGWELWRLSNRADFKSRGGNNGVAVLEIGSWRGAPALVSGGGDGWLRIWSQRGAPLLGIDVGEPVTALAFLPDDGIAVGTRRGVVVLQVAYAKIPMMGALEAKLAELRIAAREQDSVYWDWRSWREGVFPPAAPGFHHGPAGEIAELLRESPAQTFRGLSSWLEDDTPLVEAREPTVADVACTLMGSYSHAAFDELCDILADRPGTAGAESRTPFLLVQSLMMIAPDAGARVCERWSTGDARRTQLATACVRRMLWRDPSAELRARLLAVDSVILNADPTPLARTEALHTLAEWPETRDQVIGELADRFRGIAEGYASASMLSKALATHFDLVLAAFKQRLMRDPARYDSGELSALAAYAPATDTEADRIMDLYERLWDAGPGEPSWAIVRSLMTFAEHPSKSRAQAVALAIKIAQTPGSSRAPEDIAEAVFNRRYDAEFRQQIVDAITSSADQEMKGELAAELAKAVELANTFDQFPDIDEKLYEPILHAAADQLESNAMELLSAARESRSFASALARVVQQTTPQPGRPLDTFAEQAVRHADPQTAARQVIEIFREEL